MLAIWRDFVIEKEWFDPDTSACKGENHSKKSTHSQKFLRKDSSSELSDETERGKQNLRTLQKCYFDDEFDFFSVRYRGTKSKTPSASKESTITRTFPSFREPSAQISALPVESLSDKKPRKGFHVRLSDMVTPLKTELHAKPSKTSPQFFRAYQIKVLRPGFTEDNGRGAWTAGASRTKCLPKVKSIVCSGYTMQKCQNCLL